MITLEDFKNNNLKINWKIIDIGCLGSKIFRNELSYDDIINFSLEKFDEKNKIILKIISSMHKNMKKALMNASFPV